jgi:hypothetical protein
LLQAEGITPVALHFFSPDIDDLAYLQDAGASGAFCPAQTVLVLNEGLIKDARPVDAAFAELREHSFPGGPEAWRSRPSFHGCRAAGGEQPTAVIPRC